jgi:two-component system LytT family response regulator
MRRYNAIVVDDERFLRDSLIRMIGQNCPEIKICGEAGSAFEARELVKDKDIDFIFLDISMPGEDGFAFLRSIRQENYGIIFTTAHEEFALRALKASAIDFLLKPINEFELKEAVIKAVGYYDLRFHKAEIRDIYHDSLNNLQESFRNREQPLTRITVSEQFGFRMINLSELMYLKADSNYTVLRLSTPESIVATRTLGDFEKILDSPAFFRIHKSAIINLHFLKAFSSYQGYFAVMKDGTNLNISRGKLSEFHHAVENYTKSYN